VTHFDGADDDTPDPLGDLAAGLNQIFSLFGAGAGGPGAAGLAGLGGALGSPNWEQARQSAAALATQGHSDANVDPLVRMQYEQLARVAELQVARVTGLSLTRSGAALAVTPVNRSQFARDTVDDYRPLFEKLADSLGRMMTAQMGQIDATDLEEMTQFLPPGFNVDLSAIMAQASSFIGPMMLVTLAGSTAGQLGSRAFGSYDLPIPRHRSDEVLIVATALDEFGQEWSLPLDDLRLYVCISEMAMHAVLSVPHVAARLEELLAAHADGFEADPEAIQRNFGDLDDFDDFDPADPESLAELQGSLLNPEMMLNAIRSDQQRALVPQIDALVSVLIGYVDWVVDTIATTMLSSHDMVAEAFRRRRVEAGEASRFIERLFGLQLTRENCALGSAFIDGVVQRAGTDALSTLWRSVDDLPTPNELELPGLWLARVGIGDDDQELPALDESFEVPDFPDFEA